MYEQMLVYNFIFKKLPGWGIYIYIYIYDFMAKHLLLFKFPLVTLLPCSSFEFHNIESFSVKRYIVSNDFEFNLFITRYFASATWNLGRLKATITKKEAKNPTSLRF